MKVSLDALDPATHTSGKSLWQTRDPARTRTHFPAHKNGPLLTLPTNYAVFFFFLELFVLKMMKRFSMKTEKEER